jgi:hypothetical protein
MNPRHDALDRPIVQLERPVLEPPTPLEPGDYVRLVGPGQRERLDLSSATPYLVGDADASLAFAPLRHSGDGSGVPCRAHRPATARVTA